MEAYDFPNGSRFLPGLTKRRLTALRKQEPDGWFARHLDAAILRKGGHTVGEIASEIGVTTQTVQRWLTRMVEAGGVGAEYRATCKRGRAPAFTPEQLKDLESDMERRPHNYGLDSATWTSRTVAQHARHKFGIDIPHHSMRRILTRDNVNWPGSAAAKAARG